MIEYAHKIESIETKTPISIKCDVCKNVFDYIADTMLIQEFHHIHFTGGYDSIFGDGTTMKADICQDCVNKLLGEYLIEDIPDFDN